MDLVVTVDGAAGGAARREDRVVGESGCCCWGFFDRDVGIRGDKET